MYCYDCKGCKSDLPSIAADFDFVLPSSVHGRPVKELTFSVFLEMRLKSKTPLAPDTMEAPLLQAQIDMYPEMQVGKMKTNDKEKIWSEWQSGM